MNFRGHLVLICFFAVSCNRDRGEFPSYFTEFASKVTNSIAPNELLTWADSIFIKTNASPGVLAQQEWPPFLTTNKEIRPTIIILDQSEGPTSQVLMILYGGGFRSMGMHVFQEAPQGVAETPRIMDWTNRLSLYYSP